MNKKTKSKIDNKKSNSISEDEKNISKEKIEANQKESKRKMVIQYFIPLVLLIIVALIYIPLQKNVILIPFSILTLITLFGWDASTRTCPKCKKWNSVIWERIEKKREKMNKSKKNVLGKNKNVVEIKKYRIIHKKCTNCGHKFESERKNYL